MVSFIFVIFQASFPSFLISLFFDLFTEVFGIQLLAGCKVGCFVELLFLKLGMYCANEATSLTQLLVICTFFYLRIHCRRRLASYCFVVICWRGGVGDRTQGLALAQLYPTELYS